MDLSCPVSAERGNESVIRIVAFLVALITIVCILFSNYWTMLFLVFDFGIRAFFSGKLSVLKLISIQLAKAFSITPKMTDLAPKKFAATLGCIFSLFIAVFYLLNFQTIADILAVVMLCFAVLESLFAICVGCYVYSFWQFFVKNNPK
ncbi:DUF4395 domain-containing protein [Pedobacter paludis]|uniref:DUF4395 domain-containing protein n=1 Tax=Pedobacter paludis TaxID=2203212 RepID=A0A317EY21_9SPHI|nr:DUF4395 domain-containing protein [Pedobacter paludis]PWS31312.1 hypothetical protein DF947_11950 [Pedobacter paludis]